MAIPRSACASAGASLMPSPTMATRFPPACSFFTSATFWSGQHLGQHVDRCRPRAPPSRPRPALVARDHPHFQPHVAQARARPPRASGLMVSAISIDAGRRAIHRDRDAGPSHCHFAARHARPHAVARLRRELGGLLQRDAALARLLPRWPCPADARNSARAEAASRSSSLSSNPAAGVIARHARLAARDGAGLVQHDGVDACAISSASPPLIRMPRSAPRPVPTMMAVGVASPSAHGQAMISTATAFTMAVANGAKNSQRAKVSSAAASTPSGEIAAHHVGQPRHGRARALRLLHHLDHLLQHRAAPHLGGLVPQAARAVDGARRTPPRPRALSTGMLSPVSMRFVHRRFALASPSPSTGMRSPGRTTTRSPARTSSTGDFHLRAVAQHARRGRLQVHQPADGFARPARAPALPACGPAGSAR